MIENKIEELFNSINRSNEYREYQEMVAILDKNEEIKQLITEIKSLQKKATNLEYQQNEDYNQVDKIIEEKLKILKSKKDYQEYQDKLVAFNRVLTVSSLLLEDYINDKVGI